MIIDKIESIKLYTGLNLRLKKALDYLIETDFINMEAGRHEIDNTMFVLVNNYNSETKEAAVLEAHKKYIDVQYILKGSEVIEYESFDEHNIFQAYDEDNDYILYKPKNTNKLKFTEKMFAIFFPNDLHIPGIVNEQPSKIKKIVIKVLIK